MKTQWVDDYIIAKIKGVDYLIRNKEINLIEMSGIITPGTYINFLYQLYLDPSSIVKGIKIYKKGV